MKVVVAVAAGLAISLVLVACGSKDDDEEDAKVDPNAEKYYGVYTVTDKLEAPAGCDAAALVSKGAVADVDKFFKLTKDEFFGIPIPMTYKRCTNATTCSEALDLTYAISRYDGTKWTDDPSRASSGTAPKCYLSLSTSAVQLGADGVSLELSQRRQSGEVDLPPGMTSCIEKEALDALYAQYGATLPCTSLLVTRASKNP